MKKFIIVMAFWVVFLSFSACDNSGGMNQSDLPSYLQLKNGSKIDIHVQYLRIGSGLGPENPISIVISSKSELERFYSGKSDENYFWTSGYKNAISKYSDDYFVDNFLIIVFIEEVSGSNRHKVEKVDMDGNIVIERLLPGPDMAWTHDMATWNIIIELNNSYKIEKYQVMLF